MQLKCSKNQMNKFDYSKMFLKKCISDLKTFIFSINKKLILYTRAVYVTHVSVCKLYKKKLFIKTKVISSVRSSCYTLYIRHITYTVKLLLMDTSQ